MVKTQRAFVAVLALTSAALFAGCSGTGPADSVAAAPAATASVPQYTSRFFKIPLTVTVGGSLTSAPASDSPPLLTWDSATDPEKKIRFFVPAEVYPPGSAKPIAPPSDYVGYLKRLTKSGADLTDVRTATVGGRAATEFTAVSVEPAGPGGFWDGTLGCPSPGVDVSDDCFGIQPEYVVRLAVVEVNGTTLLAWARIPQGIPDAGFFAMFETMLTSVQFR